MEHVVEMVCNFLKQTFFFFTLCPTKEGNSFEAWFLVVVLELEQLNVWKVLTLKQCIFVWVCVSRNLKKKKKKIYTCTALIQFRGDSFYFGMIRF